MASLNKVWKDQHLTLTTKLQVLSVLIYAAEMCMWTPLAADMKAFEALHMKCQRQILGTGIHWFDFVSYVDVLARNGFTPLSAILALAAHHI